MPHQVADGAHQTFAIASIVGGADVCYCHTPTRSSSHDHFGAERTRQRERARPA